MTSLGQVPWQALVRSQVRTDDFISSQSSSSFKDMACFQTLLPGVEEFCTVLLRIHITTYTLLVLRKIAASLEHWGETIESTMLFPRQARRVRITFVTLPFLIHFRTAQLPWNCLVERLQSCMLDLAVLSPRMVHSNQDGDNGYFVPRPWNGCVWGDDKKYFPSRWR
jgi:hypothetical protein